MDPIRIAEKYAGHFGGLSEARGVRPLALTGPDHSAYKVFYLRSGNRRGYRRVADLAAADEHLDEVAECISRVDIDLVFNRAVAVLALNPEPGEH